MNFKTSRKHALDELEKFINGEIINYSSKRNYDFGPKNRKNISCLSPYITHRLLTEYEVSKKVLSKYPYQKMEKYIQEIFWRVYWKGWLELRPRVWSDFIDDLNNLEDSEEYQKAINSNTEIECFNNWVKELKEFNYLHNHTRMWFASIWIFTLGLPWQKGAEFFMKYLLDGDAATNTLSWRWVAGLQTKGKHYVAQAWNINKFTNEKYKNIKLNETAKPIVDDREYKISPLNIQKNKDSNDFLIVFDNELNTKNLKLKKYKKIYFMLLDNTIRSLKLDKKNLDFKQQIINNCLIEINGNSELITGNKIENFFENNKSIDIVYPGVGENKSFLEKMIKKHSLTLNYITRDEDEFCWNFSNKGYFNFKLSIPKILSKFNLN